MAMRKSPHGGRGNFGTVLRLFYGLFTLATVVLIGFTCPVVPVDRRYTRCTLAQESDTLLVWPSISTAIRPTASGLVGWTAVPSLPLRSAATVRPVIRTRVPAGYTVL